MLKRKWTFYVFLKDHHLGSNPGLILETFTLAPAVLRTTREAVGPNIK